MSELFCEELAHEAGFPLPIGNWIAPTGELIFGDEGCHHYETLRKYLNSQDILSVPNSLLWMNNKVKEGYLRLVFRSDILFQVGAFVVDEIWSNKDNYQSMLFVLKRLSTYQVDVHIFSEQFYVIGTPSDIVNKVLDNLQIKTIGASHGN